MEMSSLYVTIFVNTTIIGVLILIAIVYSLRHKQITKRVHESLKGEADRKIEAIFKEYKKEISDLKTEYCKNVRDMESKISEIEGSAELEKERNIESGRQQANTEFIGKLSSFAVKHYKSKQNRERTLAFIRQFKEKISPCEKVQKTK